MFRLCLLRLLSVPLCVLALLAAREGSAVWHARQRTPAILASVARCRPANLFDVQYTECR